MDSFMPNGDYMAIEHGAWLDVINELRSRGIGDVNQGGKDQSLCRAIERWGEELVQLRLHDPNPAHADNALEEKRSQYPGRDMAEKYA